MTDDAEFSAAISKPFPRIPYFNPEASTAPVDLARWLISRGWEQTAEAISWNVDGSSTVIKASWSLPGGGAKLQRLTWEQAMAYEFYRFASFGGIPVEG